MDLTSQKEPPNSTVYRETDVAPSLSPTSNPTAPPAFITQPAPAPDSSLGPDSTTTESNTNMAPGGGGGRRPSAIRREADLSAVLSMPQKTDLITLVTAIIENMQSKLLETFEQCGTDIVTSQTSVKIWVYTPEMLSQKSAPEPISPSMAELKKDALASFRRWQTHVMKKLGEIIVVVNTNPSQQRQGGPSRGGGFGQRTHQQGTSGAKKAASDANSTLSKFYPPLPTSLSNLQMDKRKLLLRALLLQTLSIDHYASYSRTLMLYITSSLRLAAQVLAEDEARVAKILSKVQKDTYVEETPRTRPEEGRNSRRWKSAANASGGHGSNSVIAPLVAAGAGIAPGGGPTLGPTTISGLLGPAADNSTGLSTIFGIYHINKATSKMMDTFTKDVQDFALMPLYGADRSEYRDARDVPSDDRRLRVVLVINGWAAEKEDIARPWRVLGNQSEVFALRWDTEALLKVGTCLETVVKSAAWSSAKEDMAGRSIIETLKHATWPVSLMKVSKLLDNPWCVGIVRADKAGAALADAILAKVHGERGITLIGFGLAARVIYTCLMNLAERRAFTLVDSAVLIGGPISSEGNVWVSMKSVTAGRLVNVYSYNDILLGFMYRTGSHQFGVAGLQPVDGVKGVENVNISDLVTDHLQYQHLMGTILKRVGWDDLNSAHLAREENSLAILNKKALPHGGNKKENIPTQRGPRQRNDQGNNNARGQRGKMGKTAL